MKGIFISFIPFIIIGILLSIGNYFLGHSISDITGTWHAKDIYGAKKIVKITNKKLVLDGQVLKISKYKLKIDKKTISTNQNLSGTYYKSDDNIVRDNQEIYYYGFSTQNQKSYSIAFPENDKNIAVLIASDSSDTPLQGEMLYALNRETVPDYDTYRNKYIKKDIKDE